MSFINSDNSLNPIGITITPTSNFIGIINKSGTLLSIGDRQNLLNLSNSSSNSYANINFINNASSNAIIGIGCTNINSLNSFDLVVRICLKHDKYSSSFNLSNTYLKTCSS